MEKTAINKNVYDLIKKMIFGWDLLPGEKINIKKLSEELYTSPIPLREALSRLQSEKLVVLEPNKGYRVSDILDENSMDELQEARMLIETYAIRKVIQFNRLDVLEELTEINQQLSITNRKIGHQEEYLEFSNLDRAFHVAIIRECGNHFLLESYEKMYIHFHQARHYILRGGIDRAEGVREHFEIIEAIRTRDVYRAEIAVKDHIIESKKRRVFKKE